MGDAGVHDHGVDAAPGPDHPRETSRHRSRIGHVHGGGHDAQWIAPAKILDQGIQSRTRQIGGSDVAALDQQGFADPGTNGPGGAGHQHHAAAQAVPRVCALGRFLGLLVAAEFHVAQVVVAERQVVRAAFPDGSLHGQALQHDVLDHARRSRVLPHAHQAKTRDEERAR